MNAIGVIGFVHCQRDRVVIDCEIWAESESFFDSRGISTAPGKAVNYDH